MPVPRWLPALAALAALAAPACSGGGTSPTPKKISDEGPLIAPPQRPKKTGPFRDPRIEPPPPRSEPQLPDEELERALADARKLAKEQPDRAILTLRTCANKVPASGRCEGELAMLLADKKGYKAEFKYYLVQASETDDPKGDAEFYRRLAQTARRKGDFLAASQAMRFALDRGADAAADHAFYAETLSGETDTLPDAIAAYRAALAKDPEHHQWRYDLGSLLAQTHQPTEAMAELRAFLEATRGQDAQRDAKIEAWLIELQAEADRMGQPEKGKNRPAKGKSKPAKRDPGGG